MRMTEKALDNPRDIDEYREWVRIGGQYMLAGILKEVRAIECPEVIGHDRYLLGMASVLAAVTEMIEAKLDPDIVVHESRGNPEVGYACGAHEMGHPPATTILSVACQCGGQIGGEFSGYTIAGVMTVRGVPCDSCEATYTVEINEAGRPVKDGEA